MKSLKFNVFGKHVLVTEHNGGWTTYYLSTEGKRRPAIDIVVPSDIQESEIGQYLDDLCHEWATERNPVVKRID